MQGFKAAIKKAGSVAELARMMGLDRQTVHGWHKRGVPLDKAAAMELATGIRAERIRADVDWIREGGKVVGYTVWL